MPLPYDAACEPIEPPTQCLHVWDLAQSLLESVGTTMVETCCWPPDAIELLVSHGQPTSWPGMCDTLSVWVESIARENPVLGAPSPLKVEMTLQLWESSYPTIYDDNGDIVTPPVDALNRANQWLMSHGGILWDALTAWAEAQPCSSVTVGPQKPLGPSGGCAGWSIKTTLVI